MKLFVGYQLCQTDAFLERILFKREMIDEVYFSWDTMPSGRSAVGLQHDLMPWEASQRQREQLKRIADAGIGLHYYGCTIADRLIQYLQEHYRENLTVKEIAYHFNYHDGHINRIMRSATGTTIHSYLILCRMNAAKSFLLGTDMTVSQIAEAVGMKSDAYFCNSFKKMVGISPNEYRCRFKNK